MRVLFIGNSYTYYNNMPLLFEQLANSNNKNVTVRSITKGGRMLESYTDVSDETTAVLDALLARKPLMSASFRSKVSCPLPITADSLSAWTAWSAS